MAPVGGSGGWQGENTFGSTFRGLGGLVRPKYDKSNFFYFLLSPSLIYVVIQGCIVYENPAKNATF